jgi:galactokinase
VHEPGVESLRDVDPDMLARHATRLQPVQLARAEHVVSEIVRVLRTVEALEGGNLAAVGRLFAESHASLRDRFEVSSPELDAMVEIANATPGVIASRMTGAGFGGCTVNLVHREALEAFRAAIEREYPERTGREPHVFVVNAADGAGLMVAAETGD